MIVSSSVSVLQAVSEVYVPEVVYVKPSTNQVYELHALTTVVLFVLGMIDKSSVMTESQPATEPLLMVNVALLLLAEYVFPSIQVKFSQAIWKSVDVEKELMVKLSVMTESQPVEDPFGIVNVGELVEVE